MVLTASNYTTFLQSETIDKISELETEHFHFEDMLIFIDEHSEQDFVKYYETYVDQSEKIGYEIVDAYLSENGFDDIDSVDELFVGEYQSEADFAESYVNDISDVTIPDFVVIDWQETYDRNLQYDFDAIQNKTYGVYIFRRYL